MLMEVTIPAEEAVRHVPASVRPLPHHSRRAELSVTFNCTTTWSWALLQVQAAIAERSGSLPTGTTINVRRMDPTVFGARYSLSSDARSLVELRDLSL